MILAIDFLHDMVNKATITLSTHQISDHNLLLFQNRKINGKCSTIIDIYIIAMQFLKNFKGILLPTWFI